MQDKVFFCRIGEIHYFLFAYTIFRKAETVSSTRFYFYDMKDIVPDCYQVYFPVPVSPVSLQYIKPLFMHPSCSQCFSCMAGFVMLCHAANIEGVDYCS